MLNRRGLLGGMGALLCAPAIVRASSLMPVSVVEPFGSPLMAIIGSGFHLGQRFVVPVVQLDGHFRHCEFVVKHIVDGTTILAQPT